MTSTELNTLINFKCKTNDTTFPQATKLPIVNMFVKDISSRIVEKNAGYFIVPTTFDLVADQREYGWPDDLLNRMHKLEIKFSSTTSRFPAKNLKDYHGSETESEIVKNFTNDENGFAYVIRRRAIYILSGTITAVIGGGRLWYHAYPADLADLAGATDMSVDPSTTTFGFPRQFHELLARRVTMEYKGSLPKPLPLNELERNYEIDLERQLQAISRPDNSAEIIGDSPSAVETGDFGWNY
jgi:hypothetical protein